MNLPISKNVLELNDTIETALRVIDAAHGKLGLVVDAELRLVGTVSDGDLRRAFLRGLTLTSPVCEVMNRNPITLNADAAPEIALELMRDKIIRHIPVVDSDKRIVALRSLDDFLRPRQRSNWVVIMAGGEGVRLRPLTEDLPKPMVPLGDRPLLQVIAENLKVLGFTRFYISVNYRADAIIRHFGDGSRMGLDIRYLREDKPLGTAGPLGLLPDPPDEPFIVMNGDIITKMHFPSMLDFHVEHSAAATMAVREYNVQVPYGVIKVDDMVISSIEEKPTQRHLISGGIYVFSPEVLRLIPADQRYDMPSLFNDLTVNNLSAVPFFLREYWLDIGHLEDLAQARRDFHQIFVDE